MFDWIVSMLEWINDSSAAETIRVSEWVFPAFETIHVVATAFVMGSIARVDLRLMGLIQRDRPITEVSAEMLPYSWAGFAVSAIFGTLLWASKPFTYFEIVFFDAKMILILLAGANMLYFEYVTSKNIAQWDRNPLPPAAARVAGSLSMAFWLSVVVCGRFIGFV